MRVSRMSVRPNPAGQWRLTILMTAYTANTTRVMKASEYRTSIGDGESGVSSMSGISSLHAHS